MKLETCENWLSSCASAPLCKHLCCAGLLSTRWPWYKAISRITTHSHLAFIFDMMMESVQRDGQVAPRLLSSVKHGVNNNIIFTMLITT